MSAQAGYLREPAFGLGGVPASFYDAKTTLRFKREELPRIVMRPTSVTDLLLTYGTLDVGADVEMDLPNKPTASLWKDAFGSVSGSGPLSYAPDPTLFSFVWQVGKAPSGSTTLLPRTDWGCVMSKWSVGAQVGQVGKFNFSYIARSRAFYRVVTDGVTTNTSTAITSATAVFTAADRGRPITGTGIPAATTIASVTSATAAVLSAAATATGTGVTFTIGVALASPSYTATMAPYSCVDACLNLSGAELKCKAFTIDVDKKLDIRKVLCTELGEKPAQGPDPWAITGTIDHWFDSDAIDILAANGNQAALVATFNNGTESAVFTANVQILGDPTSANVVGLQPKRTMWRAGHATPSSALSLVLTNGETSAP